MFKGEDQEEVQYPQDLKLKQFQSRKIEQQVSGNNQVVAMQPPGAPRTHRERQQSQPQRGPTL